NKALSNNVPFYTIHYTPIGCIALSALAFSTYFSISYHPTPGHPYLCTNLKLF
ncbi:36031_t:CDS:1, partial [Racocetra persica]